MPGSSLAFLMGGIPDEVERAARCRELRALAFVYLVPDTRRRSRFADPAARPQALALLDAVPALPRRRLLSAFGALMAPRSR